MWANTPGVEFLRTIFKFRKRIATLAPSQMALVIRPMLTSFILRCLSLPSRFIYNRNGRFHTRDGLFVWEEFFFSDTPPKYPDRDCVGRRRTGTRHGNVYRSVREKQVIVVYRQRVLQTVATPRAVSLVFRGHDLLKISNINPQQEARFSLWKKFVHWESGGKGA